MAKAGYVDGFVFPVPKKNIEAYKKMAREGAWVWKKFGALDYYECSGEDLTPKNLEGMGKPRSFKDTAKAGVGDTVWFSFVTFKSRAHRDAVNKKVMDYMGKKYANVKNKDFSMPFDPKKMAYGGFKVIVSK
jgi:uncharacterized protein YbaA (DUF1428 family)